MGDVAADMELAPVQKKMKIYVKEVQEVQEVQEVKEERKKVMQFTFPNLIRTQNHLHFRCRSSACST